MHLAPTNPVRVQSSPNPDYRPDAISSYWLWDVLNVNMGKSGLTKLTLIDVFFLCKSYFVDCFLLSSVTFLLTFLT